MKFRRCRGRSTTSKKNIMIIKEGKVWRRQISCLISSFVLKCNQLGLTFGILLPEYNYRPRTRIKCGTENLNWATGQALTPIGLEWVFRGAPKQWIHRWQRCQSCLQGYLGESYSTGSAFWENDVERLPYAVNNPLQLPMDSREGSTVSLNPMTRICQ